jgi:hypothetical protein
LIGRAEKATIMMLISHQLNIKDWHFGASEKGENFSTKSVSYPHSKENKLADR